MTGWLDRRPLVRLFLGRFVESELVPPGVAQVQLAIWTIALVAAPTYLLSMTDAFKYGRLPPGRVPDAILADQLLFVTFAMMALGLVALVVWEAVYPDRRDVRILGVLPVSGRAQILARLTALGLVAVLFAVAVNLPAAVVYGLALWRFDAAAGPLRGIGAHLAATSAAGLFAFVTLVVLQGLVLAVAGRRLARRLGLGLQALFVVVLLQALLFVPYLSGLVGAGFTSVSPSAIDLFPPAWYLALYAVLAGGPGPVPGGLAVAAVLATLLPAAAAAGLIAGSHQRLVRLALETPPGLPSARAALVDRASAAIGRRIAADPIARAAGGFVVRTVLRSRTHLTLVATCTGLAVALAVGGLVPTVVRLGAAAFDRPRIAVLSISLVANFVMIVGLRVLLALPTELSANWVFRVNAPEQALRSIVQGVRRAALATVVAPIAAASLLVAASLWGLRTGVLHGLFTAVAGLLLLDAVTAGVRWLPFTRAYRMQAHSRLSWPLVLLAFSAYAYTLARLETALLARTGLILTVTVAGVAVSAGLGWWRDRTLGAPPGLSFESDDSEALFAGFGLSEGLAAGPTPSGQAPRD